VPQRVLGVLGGADLAPELLRKWAESAEILIAADGGANRLLEVGCTPNAIVGDLDSFVSGATDVASKIYRDEDQNYTDCDKLLRYGQDQALLPLTLVGIEGNRIDHVISSIHSVAASSIREKVTLAFRRSLAWVLGPGVHAKQVGARRTVSLIPLTSCENVETDGLRWPLRGRTLEAGILTSISNESNSEQISVSLRSGLLLLTVEHSPEEFPIW